MNSRKEILRKNYHIYDILDEKLNHLKMNEELKFENELKENYLKDQQHKLLEQTLNQSNFFNQQEL